MTQRPFTSALTTQAATAGIDQLLTVFNPTGRNTHVVPGLPRRRRRQDRPHPPRNLGSCYRARFRRGHQVRGYPDLAEVRIRPRPRTRNGCGPRHQERAGHQRQTRRVRRLTYRRISHPAPGRTSGTRPGVMSGCRCPGRIHPTSTTAIRGRSAPGCAPQTRHPRSPRPAVSRVSTSPLAIGLVAATVSTVGRSPRPSPVPTPTSTVPSRSSSTSCPDRSGSTTATGG